MPSKILNFKTPLDFLKQEFPKNRYFSSLPLKVFGCIYFVHVHAHNGNKLSPQAIECVFLGYSSTTKGYKMLRSYNTKGFC